MSTPAVIYAAKSTEDKKGSIPDQLKDGRKLAVARGLEPVAECQDEAMSAYHGDRGPGLAAAMAMCEQLVAERGSCALVVQHSDRLARGDAKQARHLIEVVLWAIKTEVELLSVQDPEILAGGDLALLLGAIGGMRNHQDSKRKGAAVSSGLRRRAADRGKPVAGARPYGYRWVAELVDGGKVSRLELVPAEAHVVERMFADTVNGVSQRALARQLTEEGIPSATGKPWGQASVSKLLQNPLYAGRVRHNGEEFAGVHEPIVSEELWARAAAIRASSVRRKGGRWPKGAHLLTKGLLRCGHCGYAMTPRGPDPTRHNYEAYECHGRRTRGVDFCDQRTVRRHVIDEALLAELNRQYIDLDETRRRIEARVAADRTVAQEALVHAEQEARQADERIGRVQRAFQDGYLEPDDYAEQRRDLLREREAALAAAERQRGHVEKVEQALALVDAEAGLYRRFGELQAAVSDGIARAPDLNAVRVVLRQLFDRIELISWPGFGKAASPGAVAWESIRLDSDLVLLPHLRPEAVDVLEWEVRRIALPAGSIDDNLFSM